MRLVTFLFACLFTASLSAQPDPELEGVSLSGIQRQTRFIEAKQTALLGKTDKAIALFTALSEEAPEMDAAQFELGRLQFAAEETDAAIDHLVKAYALRPNEVYAAFLADLYEASGRYREGAELYARLIKQRPEEVDNYLRRAEFLTRAQDVKGAIATYNDLEDRIGINVDVARHKHLLYLGSGDNKRAEKELTALVESAPINLQYHHMLAGFYVSQGDQSAARQTYREILRWQPDDVRAQLALQDSSPGKSSASDAEIMAMLGNTDINLDLKIGKLLPLVNQLALTNDPALGQSATLLAAELRRVHPDEAKAAALQGDVFFHAGQLAEAATAYKATLELDDTVYPVWEQLLGILYLDNQTTELHKYAEAALDVYPNRPAVYIHYALAEALRTNFKEATSLLQEAQLMTSGQPAAAIALSELTKAIQGLEAGDATTKIDLAKLPGGKNSPLAFLLTNSGNATALAAYDSPTNTNPLFLEMLGDAQAKAGDKTAAAKAYARAKAAGSKSTTLREKLSKVQ
jgi:predicted Zn-dependent protease